MAHPLPHRVPPRTRRPSQTRPRRHLLFLTKSGHPFTPAKLLHLVRSYATTHHLPASTTTHSLRHACATHLLSEGLSLQEIGEHLGHRHVGSTRLYAKVDAPGLRTVADWDLGGVI